MGPWTAKKPWFCCCQKEISYVLSFILLPGMHLTIALLLRVCVEPFHEMLKFTDSAENNLEEADSFLLHQCVVCWMDVLCISSVVWTRTILVQCTTNLQTDCRELKNLKEYFFRLLLTYSWKLGVVKKGVKISPEQSRGMYVCMYNSTLCLSFDNK